MKDKNEKKEKSGNSFKKQLVSGGVYIALAAAIVTVTMGSVSKIMNGDMGYVAPDINLESDIGAKDIVLPGLSDDNPVAVNPGGVEAKVENEKKPSSDKSGKTDTKKNEETPENSDNEKKDAEKGGEGESENTLDVSESEVTDNPAEISAEPSDGIEYPTDPADPVFDGRFYKVADGYINRSYSMDELIYSPTMKDFRTHDGIDITGEPGSTVRAFSDGTVTETLNHPLMGRTVVIDHGDGITAYYMNLSDSLPQNIIPGAAVSAGDVIGGIGTTASIECADVSHIHLTVKRDGVLIDPAQFLGSEK